MGVCAAQFETTSGLARAVRSARTPAQCAIARAGAAEGQSFCAAAHAAMSIVCMPPPSLGLAAQVDACAVGVGIMLQQQAHHLNALLGALAEVLGHREVQRNGVGAERGSDEARLNLHVELAFLIVALDPVLFEEASHHVEPLEVGGASHLLVGPAVICGCNAPRLSRLVEDRSLESADKGEAHGRPARRDHDVADELRVAAGAHVLQHAGLHALDGEQLISGEQIITGAADAAPHRWSAGALSLTIGSYPESLADILHVRIARLSQQQAHNLRMAAQACGEQRCLAVRAGCIAAHRLTPATIQVTNAAMHLAHYSQLLQSLHSCGAAKARGRYQQRVAQAAACQRDAVWAAMALAGA
eukprot:scaffold19596_cov62-Phaeocystis_antarctica.AAC.1